MEVKQRENDKKRGAREKEEFECFKLMVGTYPKCPAQMLAKVPKITPKYPKVHAQMLAKVPKIKPKFPKCLGLSLLHARDDGGQGGAVHVAFQLTPELETRLVWRLNPCTCKVAPVLQKASSL